SSGKRGQSGTKPGACDQPARTTRLERPTMTDEHGRFESLMQQLQDGSEEAARELCATYWNYIVRCVRRRLRPALRTAFDSSDFVQKMWKSVFEERDKLRDIDSPEALKRYLAAIAIHKVQDAGRRQGAIKCAA